MALEKFVRTKVSTGIPKVSIWSKGSIAFNIGAVQKYGLKNYEYAILYYDNEEKKIAIKFTNDSKEEGAVKVLKREASGIVISSLAFFKYYGIDYQKTRSFNIEYDKKNDLYLFSLLERSEKKGK